MGIRSATAIAVLVFAASTACTSGGTHAVGPTDATHSYSCARGERCAPPQPPATTIELGIDGHHYTGRPGQLLTGQQPVRVTTGHHVVVQVGIQAAANIRVSDVWLTVNSYPSGFDGSPDHPSGKYRVVLHHAGTLHGAQQLVGYWTAKRLFGTGALDLSAHFAVGDFGIGVVLGHLDVEGG